MTNKLQEPNISSILCTETKMAAADDARVSQVSFYDRYGFAVYNPGSEFAEEDCRTHEYK